MTYSMTAFAQEEARKDQIVLRWELRSVNHRYLDASFRLPEHFKDMEHQLHNLLKHKVSRGKLDCTLRLDGISTTSGGLSINQDVLQDVLGAAAIIRNSIPDSGTLNILDVLKWPGLADNKPVQNEELKTLSLQTFEAALASLVSMRQREGEALRTTLLARLQELETIVEQLQKSSPEIAGQLKEKVEARLNELQSISLDKGRLEQEILFLVQKADVQEELDRLVSHIREVRSTFDQTKPIGRRLDFLMQELNREANTLGSKSVLTETSLQSVEIKVLIEQMREQIQNIE